MDGRPTYVKQGAGRPSALEGNLVTENEAVGFDLVTMGHRLMFGSPGLEDCDGASQSRPVLHVLKKDHVV